MHARSASVWVRSVYFREDAIILSRIYLETRQNRWIRRKLSRTDRWEFGGEEMEKWGKCPEGFYSTKRRRKYLSSRFSCKSSLGEPGDGILTAFSSRGAAFLSVVRRKRASEQRNETRRAEKGPPFEGIKFERKVERDAPDILISSTKLFHS